MLFFSCLLGVIASLTNHIKLHFKQRVNAKRLVSLRIVRPLFLARCHKVSHPKQQGANGIGETASIVRQ
jgi:hypothetical protein